MANLKVLTREGGDGRHLALGDIALVGGILRDSGAIAISTTTSGTIDLSATAGTVTISTTTSGNISLTAAQAVSFSANSGNISFAASSAILVNAGGANAISLNVTTGTGGVNFGDGASSTVAQMTSGGLLRVANGAVGTPSLGFLSDTDTGIYRVGADILGLATGGVKRLEIELNGTLNVSGTSNYENLVTHDDDVPNKKYVDDAITVATGFWTQQTATWAGAGGVADTATLGSDSVVVYHYVTTNTSTAGNVRSGTITIVADSSANTVALNEVATPDIGDTSDISFTVAMAGGTMTLTAVNGGGDSWSFSAARMINSI